MAKRPRKLETIDDLAPAPYNPRQIEDRAATGLRASLDRFGDLGGLVWNSRSGYLIAGHQRLDQLRAIGAALVTRKAAPPTVVVGDHSFPVRVVDLSPAEEKAANLAANNPAIAGSFTAEVDAVAREVEAALGGPDFASLNLDSLLTDAPGEGDLELKEWDASDIVMRALFIFKAPIELQAKIRAVLEREFPKVDFDEQVIHE